MLKDAPWSQWLPRTARHGFHNAWSNVTCAEVDSHATAGDGSSAPGPAVDECASRGGRLTHGTLVEEPSATCPADADLDDMISDTAMTIPKYCFNTSNGAELITVSILICRLKILFFIPSQEWQFSNSQALSALKIAILPLQQRPAW